MITARTVWPIADNTTHLSLHHSGHLSIDLTVYRYIYRAISRYRSFDIFNISLQKQITWSTHPRNPPYTHTHKHMLIQYTYRYSYKHKPTHKHTRTQINKDRQDGHRHSYHKCSSSRIYAHFICYFDQDRSFTEFHRSNERVALTARVTSNPYQVW